MRKPRWRNVFSRLLLSLLALAPAATGRLHAAEGEPAQYNLMPGDRLAVTVFNQAELTGEFVIDAGGNILMPLIGAVPVAKLSPRQVEERLIAQLSRGVLQNPSVSVRIAEYRPIYVFGDVKLPGGYPFRYGLSVLGAMALAGGPARNLTAQVAASGDFITADEHVRVLEALRRVLLVLVNRLEATRAGRDALDLSVLMPLIGSGSDVDALLKREAEMLAGELGAMRNATRMLEEQKPHLINERRAIEAQIAAEKRLAQLNARRIAEYDQIKDRGLGRSTVLNDFQKDQARNEGNLAKLEADLTRTGLALAEIELKIQEHGNAFRRRTMTELGEAMRRLGETDISLQAARKLRELRRDMAGLGPAGSTSGTYVIYRGPEDRQVATPATRGSQLMPGDILEVKTLSPLIEPDAAPRAPLPRGDPLGLPPSDNPKPESLLLPDRRGLAPTSDFSRLAGYDPMTSRGMQ